MKLFKHQEEAALWLTTHDKALLNLKPGMGKTAATIKALDILGVQNALVVCPAVLRINWARELEQWQNIKREIRIVKTGKDSLEPTGGIVICSYDLAVPGGYAGGFEVLIVDEAHYIRKESANRSKNIAALSKAIKRTWLLTGTFVCNWVDDMHNAMRNILGVYKNNYYHFRQRYCKLESNFIFAGGRRTEIKTVVGNKTEMFPELRARVAPVMFKRDWSEVDIVLPPLLFKTMHVDPGKVDVKTHLTEAWIDGGDSDALVKRRVAEDEAFIGGLIDKLGPGADFGAVLNAVGAKIPTLREYTGLQKVKETVAYVKELLRDDHITKVVIFAVHRSVIAELLLTLPEWTHAKSITGAKSLAERQEVIDAFKNRKDCKVIVCNIQAAGVGVSFTSATEVIFIEQSYIPAENAQAIARAHRVGQKKTVNVKIVALADSRADERIQRILRVKTEEVASLGL